MPLRLRENLHWCECGGRIVFLDVAADRYFGLPATARHAFLTLAAGKARSSDIEHLNILADRGLLVEGQSGQPFQAPAAIDPPVHDILTDPMPRSRLVPILRALVWELRAGWELRTRPFSGVIARTGLPDFDRQDSQASEPMARSIASAADTIALVTRSHNRCLVRALAVHAACRSQGIHAKLVVGIIAHPFSAHSWVQWGNRVVVGGFEQARLYTPILVLE